MSETLAEAALPPQRRTVRPRHAASLLVVRESARGAEVLMGLRGARHRFMPNRLVFPGGAVERADYRAVAASPLGPDVLARLAKASTQRLAPALAHAAARELAEETGLSLGAPPELSGLDYLCRAVTPPDHPIRFNARFLVVAAERIGGALGGSGELEGLRYYPTSEALALDLALPTRKVLEELLAWLALSREQRRVRERTPLLRRRLWRLE